MGLALLARLFGLQAPCRSSYAPLASQPTKTLLPAPERPAALGTQTGEARAALFAASPDPPSPTQPKKLKPRARGFQGLPGMSPVKFYTSSPTRAATRPSSACLHPRPRLAPDQAWIFEVVEVTYDDLRSERWKGKLGVQKATGAASFPCSCQPSRALTRLAPSFVQHPSFSGRTAPSPWTATRLYSGSTRRTPTGLASSCPRQPFQSTSRQISTPRRLSGTRECMSGKA